MQSGYQVRRDGIQWISDAGGVVVGFADDRGNEYRIPSQLDADGLKNDELGQAASAVSGAGNPDVAPVYRSFLGDSIIGYNTTMPWHSREVLKLAGRAGYGTRSGAAGYTSGQVITGTLDAFIADSKAVGTTHAGVLLGRNDIGQSVPIATFIANCLIIANRLLAVGIIPEFYEVTPTSGSTSAAQTTAKFNVALNNFCLKNGFHLVRWYRSLVDKSTGMWASGVNQDADHPGPAGHLLMGDLSAADLSARLALSPPVQMVTNNLDRTGYGNQNPLFLSSTTYNGTDTRPNNGHHFRTGNPAQYTSAVEAGTYGNRWRITQTTANAGWEARSSAIAVNPGDVVEVSFRYFLSGLSDPAQLNFSIAQVDTYQNNLGEVSLNRVDTPAEGFVVNRRYVIPTTGFTSVDVFWAPVNLPLNAVVWVEQMSLINLTQAGAIL